MGVFFVDSGVGGYPYFRELSGACEFGNFHYFADDVNFPFGLKTSQELLDIVDNIIEKMAKIEEIEVLVVVCNTLSLNALDYIRQKHNFPILGLDPAIKPAIVGGGKRILLWATKYSINHPKTKELIEKNIALGQEVVCYDGSAMIDYIENNLDKEGFLSFEVFKGLVSELSAKLEGFDSLILGCTHFLNIKDYLISHFKNIKIFDSLDGIKRNFISKYTPKSSTEKKLFIHSSSAEKSHLYKFLAKELNATYEGF